jgi:hypothetical protein
MMLSPLKTTTHDHSAPLHLGFVRYIGSRCALQRSGMTELD